MSNRIFRFFGFDSPVVTEGDQYGYPLTRGTQAAPVNFDSAMTVSAFWASARLLAETVAAMPLVCYENATTGRGRQVNTTNQLWRLLNFQPNRYQTRTEFFETLMLNLVTSGNAYFVKQVGPTGRLVSLLPLMSAQTTPELLDDGTLIYRHYSANGDVRVYAADTIWHIKLFGNGVVGLSPLSYAAQALGISIATGNRASTLARNGGKTNGILMVDKVLNKEQREKIRQNMAGLTMGDADGLFVLEADMKFERAALTPQDMQLLETRKFQTEDVARFMGVPSVLINDTSSTTAWGSGIQQITEGFYKLNLRPYLERIEASLQRHLQKASEWDKFTIEFNFDSLLRADPKTRAETQRASINAGTLTPNEGRAEEGRPPMDGGDVIYLNGSLVPAGTTRGE